MFDSTLLARSFAGLTDRDFERERERDLIESPLGDLLFSLVCERGELLLDLGSGALSFGGELGVSFISPDSSAASSFVLISASSVEILLTSEMKITYFYLIF